jgi:two-component SAPR family response regulator
MILWATHLRSVAAVHFRLQPGLFSLGRATADDPPDKLSVPFDPKLSRRMARIEVKPTRLVVQRDGSRAPLFVEGMEKDRFELIPGQRFSVAETVFELVVELAQTVTADEVEEARHNSPEELLEWMVAVQSLLKKESSPAELGEQINRMLPVSRVALFQAAPLQSLGEVPLVPSKSLIAQACQENEPVFYEWSGESELQPTAAQGESWALAAPIFTADDKFVLYAVGHHEAGKLERGGLCLLAQILKDHLEARRAAGLESAQAVLEQLKTDFDPRVRRAAERAQRGDEIPATLRVRSLGEFEAYLDGERLDRQWGGKQLSWLLSYLTSSSTAMGEDELVEAFWPDKGSRGKKNLTVALSRLRKYLQPGLEDNPVLLNSTGYAVNQNLSYWHDYQELEALIDFLSRRPGDEQAQRVLSSGHRLLELYRGDYLQGCYLEWAVRRRTALEQQLQEAYEFVGQVALRTKAFDDALTYAQKGLDLDPCSQGCYLVSIRAYLESGRPEQAIRQFEICRRTLAQELDLEPSTEVIEAYQRARLALP